MKRILFITQNLERTGSEMVLYYLLNNLDPTQYAVHVFCVSKGVLFDQLPAHIQKSSLKKKSGGLKGKIERKFLKLLKTDPLEKQFKRINDDFKPDFWFVNTLAIPEAHRIAEQLNVNVVTYFHELLYAYTFIKAAEMERIVNYSSVCLGCSEDVCEKLSEMGHPDVQLQPSFVDYNGVKVNEDRAKVLKHELGILPEDYVWVISGKATYMKGVDYILPILEGVKDLPVKILWLGHLPDDGLMYYTQQVVERNYKNKMFFLGAQREDYYNYLSIGNGLLLLSREECASLVLLESAYMGKTIVGFNSGIASKFVKPNMGQVIENRKVEDLVAAMKWHQEHPVQDKAALKQAALKYSLDNQLINFERLIGNLNL